MLCFKQFSRYFTALLFLFSGFVKIVDPIGTGIKMEKYFLIFSENIASFFALFIPFGLPLAVFIISLEVILGFALLLNYRMKITASVTLGLIVFFTFLTFYTAITGDPKDCGCFGDFIKLTPWQSFSKDVLLCVFVGIIFKNRAFYTPFLAKQQNDAAIAILSVFTIGFAYVNIVNLPMIDFRPYAIGKNISEGMHNGTPAITHYQFEKDGEKFTHAEAKMEYFQAPYKYVGTVTVKEEVPPSIVDFNITNLQGEEVTETLLEGKKLLILIKNIKPITPDLSETLLELAHTATQEQIEPMIVSSVSQQDFLKTPLAKDWKYHFLFLDADVSKAVIRSDVGLLLLHDGVVINKKHSKNAKKILP